MSDREQGQTKLNAAVFCGDLLLRIATRDREDAVRAKVRGAREDWKTLMTTLHQREATLQVSTTGQWLVCLDCTRTLVLMFLQYLDSFRPTFALVVTHNECLYINRNMNRII